MLEKLLKPAWQSDSVERRLVAVQKLKPSSAEDLAILDKLALYDPDQAVRIAAVDAIDKPEHLFKLFQNCADAEIKASIESGFIRLIGSHSKLKKSDYTTLIQACPESTNYVFRHCPIAQLREQLLGSFKEPELAQLIGSVDYAETRIKIAQKLETENALENARKQLKGKDKNALKIVKDKLEQRRTKQRLQNDADAQAQLLCDKLVFISKQQDWRKEFTPQYNLAVEKWRTISPAPNNQLTELFSSLCEGLDKRTQVIEHAQAIERENQACLSDLANILESSCKYSIDRLIKKQPEDSETLSEIDRRWHTLANKREVSIQDNTTYSELKSAMLAKLTVGEILNNAAYQKEYSANPPREQSAFKQYRSTLETAIDLLNQQAKLKTSETKRELEQLLELAQQTFDLAREKHDKNLNKLHQRISRLIASGEKGKLHIAQKELAATQKLASSYTGSDKVALDERLAIAAESVEKLSDWHRFATEPKLIELCQSMEALAEPKMVKKLHPDNLAQKIRKLQNAWKKLGAVNNEALWMRFKTAADAAFIPCAELFSERDQIRNDNLNTREPIITELIQLLENTNWQQTPDYATVEAALKHAHQRWQKIKNVPREEGNKQWRRYRSARQQVFDKLAPEYDRNSELQQKLIEQSQKLVSTGIDQNSFEKLKHIQSSWKEIGITRQKEDRQAWKDFKKSTDAAYSAIKNQEREKNDQYLEMLGEHHRIIEALHNLAKQNEASDPKVEALEAEYQALPMLPKDFPENKLIKLEKSYRSALNKYRKSREQKQQQIHREQKSLLRHKASLCSELELAYSAENADQELISDLIAQLEDKAIQDNSINKRLLERISLAAQTERSEFDEQRRRLCIQLEISSDIESPKEDRALRTSMQLDAMSRKGIGAINQSNSIEQLKLDWLCLPGATPKLQQKLNSRLDKLFK